MACLLISKKRLAECKRIMCRGNRSLRRIWKSILKAQNWTKRSYPKNLFRGELFEFIDSNTHGGNRWRACQDRTLHGVHINLVSIKRIQAVRDIQNEMLLGFTRLVYRQANDWSKGKNYPTKDDFAAEGFLALVDAIFGYLWPSVKFITYAQRTIDNRMVDCVHDANPLSRFTNRDRELTQKMHETIATINGPHNLQDVIDRMDLSDKHRRVLESTMMSQVVYENALQRSDSTGPAETYDAIGEKPVKNDGVEELGIMDLIKGMNLNPFEMAVVQEAMEGEGERGWQSEISKKHNHCRTAASMVLRRIRQRLEAIYASRNGGAKIVKQKVA